METEIFALHKRLAKIIVDSVVRVDDHSNFAIFALEFWLHFPDVTHMISP